MHSREGWERGEAGPKIIKGKTYRDLTEFKRPCQKCGTLFSIFVTGKIAAGHADSNSFALRNCEQHRRVSGAANTELSQLRGAHDTMTAELEGLYSRVREQFEEIQILKARLAKYELPEALAAVGCEAVQNTTPSKMPWDS